MAVKPDTRRVLGTEEATATAIQGMLGDEKQREKILSDLNEEEVAVLTLLDTIEKKMKTGVLREFCKNFCLYRISRFRLGRREIGSIITFAGIGETDKRKVRSIRDLFSGLR